MSDTVHIVKCNVLNSIQHQEIGALKDRIIQLEEELIDANGKYAALVADVALYEDRGDRIKRLEEAGDALCAAAAFMGWHMEIEKWRKAKEAKP
jgi:hypothetical protein